MSTTAIDLRSGTRAIGFAMKSLESRFEVTADNLANLETSGHKRLVASTEGYSADSFAAQLDAAKSNAGLTRDYSQGELVVDDDPSSVALDGEGFFALEKDGQLLYERALRLEKDATGSLVDQHGVSILGESGPIRAGDSLAKIEIDRDGTVKADNAVVGKMRVVTFVEPQKLEAVEGGLYRAPDDAEVVSAGDVQVRQGARERSNTDVVRELVELIVVQRQYQSAQRALAVESELRQRLNEMAS